MTNVDYNPVEELRKKIKKELLMKTIILSVLIVAVIVSVFVVRAKAGELRITKEERASFYGRVEFITETYTELEAADSLLRELDRLLPSVFAVPTEILPRIRGLAAARNLRSEITIGSEVKGGDSEPNRVELTVRVEGDLENLIGFLSALEKERFIFGGGDWELRYGGSEREYRFSISGFVYTN